MSTPFVYRRHQPLGVALALSLAGALYGAAACAGYALPFFLGAPMLDQLACGAALAVLAVPFWRLGLTRAPAPRATHPFD